MAEAVGGSVVADDRHARRQIITRGVVAAGLIVALLAGLLIFERDETPAQTARTVTRAAPRTESVATEEPATPAASAAPEMNAATSAPVMSPELSEAIKNAPDSAQAALASMATPPVTNAEPEASYDPTVPLVDVAPTGKPAAKSSAPKNDKELRPDRLQVTTSSRSAPGLPASAAPKSPIQVIAASPGGDYVVQMGVFANPGNAEELHTRLVQAGIPSQIETRVQVGPFATREQALKAQEKLKTLGMGAGILVAAKKR